MIGNTNLLEAPQPSILGEQDIPKLPELGASYSYKRL